MRSGEEVRVSTPVSTASGIAKPGICCVERRQRLADRRDRVVGQAFVPGAARSVGSTPGWYDGSTLPNAVEARPARKSPTRWPGAS